MVSGWLLSGWELFEQGGLNQLWSAVEQAKEAKTAVKRRMVIRSLGKLRSARQLNELKWAGLAVCWYV